MKKDQLTDNNTSKSTYFWTEEEHLKFIALFQTNGRKWKKIAQQMNARSTLQCRTHGQKYLLGLDQLLNQTKEVLAGQTDSSPAFCLSIYKYETERRKLLQTFHLPNPQSAVKKNTEGETTITMEHRFIPSYLLSDQQTHQNFQDKLKAILPSI